MTIKMTPEMEKLVEEKLQTGDFDTPEEVLLAGLVSLSCFRGQGDAEDLAQPELLANHKDQLEAKVSEAISGSGRYMTREDFAQMRRELTERDGSGQEK